VLAIGHKTANSQQDRAPGWKNPYFTRLVETVERERQDFHIGVHHGTKFVVSISNSTVIKHDHASVDSGERPNPSLDFLRFWLGRTPMQHAQQRINLRTQIIMADMRGVHAEEVEAG